MTQEEFELERLAFEKVMDIPDNIGWRGEYWPNDDGEATEKTWDDCCHLDSKLEGWIACIEQGIKMDQVIVHPVIEAVQKELRYHPELKAQLMAPGAVKSFEDGIAIMATYVDLALHGEYSGDDVTGVYEQIFRRLRAKRGAIAIIT